MIPNYNFQQPAMMPPQQNIQIPMQLPQQNIQMPMQPMMQPQMQPQFYPQQMNPQVVYQPVVQVTAVGNGFLTCGDVFCNCVKPNFDSCECCCGCLTACAPGFGLICGTSCYGCQKADCCSVCCAGCAMAYTTWFIFGWISACIVGFKMMGCM